MDDSLFERQTPEKFRLVNAVKVNGITNLDKISRTELQSSLEWFVAFSSFSAGFGNAGQCNYGYANSFMERVIEKRHSDGVAGMLTF